MPVVAMAVESPSHQPPHRLTAIPTHRLTNTASPEVLPHHLDFCFITNSAVIATYCRNVLISLRHASAQ
jgi:hypothetical protein